MDDIIEQGFKEIVRKIGEFNQKEEPLTSEVKKNEALLLSRMAELARPFVADVGLNMLKRGKTDGKGEMYDTGYYEEKMIILGKTEPVPYRPDDMSKKVDSQYCVLSQDGNFFELMYSSDDFITDSYINQLSSEEVIDLYGYEIMFMLYRALRDYLKEEAELVDALEKTLAFTFQKEE